MRFHLKNQFVKLDDKRNKTNIKLQLFLTFQSVLFHFAIILKIRRIIFRITGIVSALQLLFLSQYLSIIFNMEPTSSTFRSKINIQELKEIFTGYLALLNSHLYPTIVYCTVYLSFGISVAFLGPTGELHFYFVTTFKSTLSERNYYCSLPKRNHKQFYNTVIVYQSELGQRTSCHRKKLIK